MKLTGAIYALLSLAAFYGISTQAQRYVGGDISLLPDYEDAGAKYKDHDGKLLRIIVDFCIKFFIRQPLPLYGCPLFGGVCPCVGIMEIKHQIHTVADYVLAEGNDVFEVLTGVGIVAGAVVRSGEKTI